MAAKKKSLRRTQRRNRRHPRGRATEFVGGKTVCHLILLLPVMGLGLFVVLPLEVALPLYGLVVGISALLYLVVWRALRLPIQTGTEGMIGKEAEVIQELTPQGVIRHRNELWSAQGVEPIAKGEKVIILAVNGLLATVSPAVITGKRRMYQ
jgi:membrane protein implicated in regulation of membrane protease activity